MNLGPMIDFRTPGHGIDKDSTDQLFQLESEMLDKWCQRDTEDEFGDGIHDLLWNIFQDNEEGTALGDVFDFNLKFFIEFSLMGNRGHINNKQPQIWDAPTPPSMWVVGRFYECFP
jgi:hypothetical protein